MKNITTKTAMVAALIGLGGNATAADWLAVGGQVNFDVKGGSSNGFERNVRVQDVELVFEIAVREGIKAVIKTELERQLIVNGVGVQSDKFDIEKFVEEAYIQIETDKVSKLPRAVITIGKHSAAFGQKISKMPMYKDNLLHKVGRQSEVIGLTIVLSPKFLKIVDEVALSVFEAKSGDLQIENKAGVSMRLKKSVTKNIKATVSAMYKQSLDPRMDAEKRAAMGFVWDNGDGTWTFWTEGIIFKNNPTYPDSEIAATAGVSRRLGPGSVVVEYSFVNRYAQELGAAYNLPVGKNLVISPEVRYRFDQANGKKNETIVGVRARVQFDKGTTKRPLLRK